MPGIEPRTPDLCSQCSTTELRQLDNHQPLAQQPLCMCRQNPVRGRLETSLHQERTILSAFSHLPLLSSTVPPPPPNSSVEVMTKLHNCLATLQPQSFHNLVLCGDFNIDPQHSQNESLVYLQTDFQWLTNQQDLLTPRPLLLISSSCLTQPPLFLAMSLLHWQHLITSLYKLPLSSRLHQGIANLQL